VVLPNFSSSEAAATAERIRAALNNENPGVTIKVTASIGVATSESNGVNDAATLEKLADDTMYIAKEKRNAVAIAP
jgi:diguanylate cyclase